MTQPPNTPKICFIGAGNMATALVSGMLQKGFTASQITLSDPNQERRDALSKQLGVACFADNVKAMHSCDVLVLAVKPQLATEVCEALKPTLDTMTPAPLIVSIAAGITLDTLAQHLGTALPIVRCMPNTPALLQTGATALFGNAHVSIEHQALSDQVLGSVGITHWLGKESEIDAITALSGSGPAYYFLMMEAMIESGIAMGLDPELSRRFSLQTALGAARMASERTEAPDELRRQVTSPNGTTEAAINCMLDSDYKALIQKALQAAKDRSIELAAS